MPEIQIPDKVTELLKPISSDSSVGQDVEGSEDFSKLNTETRETTPDYEVWIELATEILKKKSKHLRVAIWLCYGWYRTENIKGFLNGLTLILELLKIYGDKLFPEDEVARSRILLFLNSKLSPFLIKETVNIENASTIRNIQTAFQGIIAECEKQFPKNMPQLTKTKQVIDSLVKHAAEFLGTDETIVATDADDIEMIESSSVEQIAASESGEETTPEKDEIIIPDIVKELLEPITSDSPAGQAVKDSEFYFKLNSETKKPIPDYKNWIEWATEILKLENKNLRVAVWLCYAWYRTENMKGLYNGLILTLKFLQTYGDKLFPEEIDVRSRALLFFNTKLALFLNKEKVDAGNARTVKDIAMVFQRIITESEHQFPDNIPNLIKIRQVIETFSKEAEEFLQKEGNVSSKEAKKEIPKTGSRENRFTNKTQTETTKTGNTESIHTFNLTSSNAAVISLKAVLKYFFREGKDKEPVYKIPVEGYIYGISRVLRWSHVRGAPPDQDKKTQIEGPNKIRKDVLINFFNSKNWNTLIPEIEIDFLEQDGFIYWFDAQRFVVQALEQKGGDYSEAATGIKLHLALLINRVPGLLKLKYKDGETAFANKETLAWLEDEVKNLIGGSTADEILPPIMGEDYDPISKAYEAACTELPENFDNNAQAMQQAIEGDTRRKGRFLRKLNLANYCFQARQYALAKILLTQLIQKFERYQLIEWEPALCIAVWQSLFLTNIKLVEFEEDTNKKNNIEQQQEELFKKIGNFDCVLALKLLNRKPTEGE